MSRGHSFWSRECGTHHFILFCHIIAILFTLIYVLMCSFNVLLEWLMLAMSEAQRHAGHVEGVPVGVGYDVAHMLDHVGRVSPGKPVLVFVHLYLKSEEPVKKLVKTHAHVDPLSVQVCNS